MDFVEAGMAEGVEVGMCVSQHGSQMDNSLLKGTQLFFPSHLKKCLHCLVPGSYVVITVLQTQYMVYEERVKQKINTSKYTFQCYFSGMQHPPPQKKTSDYDSLPDKT